jgi:CubicO group peptidase (beta-lactamase class C family)
MSPARHPALTRRTLLGSGMLLASMPFPALAQAPATNDPLVAAVLALFEPAAGPEGRAAFHAKHLSPGGQRRWPLAEFNRVYGAIADLSGGFALVEADHRGREIWLTLRANRQQVDRAVRVRIDRDDPTRIYDISASPAPTPYSGALPEGPIAPTALAGLVEKRIAFAAMRDEFSGACRIVAPSGEVVYERAFGLAHKARGEANTPATRFHLGSADKSFTALLTAKLVAEGRLSFETTLAEVLPDYPSPDFARACTIGHLLSHRAGLGMLFDRPRYDRLKPYSRMADLFPAFAAEPPAFAPGTAAAYSNEGFVVLGAVIEAVTGESWYDLLAEHVYRPAGMTASGHFLYHDLPERVATGYRYHQDDHLGLSPRRANDDFRGYRGNSCGGGYATVADMTAYLAALRAGKILPRPVVDQLVTQQPAGITEYGMGFMTRPLAPGRTLIGHGGGGPHSGIDGMSGIVWETGWAFSIIGNYDAPFTGVIATDIAALLGRIS